MDGGVEVSRHAVQVLRWADQQEAELKAKLREIDQVKKAARQDIEKDLGDNEIGEVDGKAEVAWTHIKVTRLNQAALKKEQPLTHAMFCETVEERRFRMIKEKNDDETE